METTSLSQRQLDLEKTKSLIGKITGTVILPDDERFDEARIAWNLFYQHHPAIIVMAKSASDIAAAVVFARESGLVSLFRPPATACGVLPMAAF